MTISVKDAILGILSKSLTAEQAFAKVDASCHDELAESLVFVLMKAKYIDPKAQKANKLKASATANKDAMDEAGIQKPKPNKIPNKASLTVVKGEECLKTDKNGQWSLDKADAAPKDKAAATPAATATPEAAAPATPDPATPAPAAAAPATPAPAAPAPAAAKAPGAGSGSGNSPTKTNTETGGSSPGGASTGGVGSGIGGAGTGGAATGGASTGGAGTVTVTISGSSSTETSSGAGAKKGGKGAGKPAGPITLNISNVGGTTDAGNTQSGDGPGAAGEGGSGKGSGGGGGGASPDEPDNFSTSRKDKVAKTATFNKGGQWSLNKEESCDRTPEVSTENHTTSKKKDSKEQKEAFVPKADNATNPKAKLHKYRDREHFLEELEKAIKPGPALNYGKMNPKQNPISNPEAAKEAKAAHYAETEAKAPVLDYQGNNMKAPKAFAGAAEHAAAVRTKLDAESKETAAETIARRQKLRQSENDHTYEEKGVNLDANPSPSQRARMTAKGDMAGDSGASMMALQQSEAEPHKDDPHHEAKEKEKAKKIKAEAEGILDLHKKELEAKTDKQQYDNGKNDGLRTVKVQPDNEMKIKAVRAQPSC